MAARIVLVHDDLEFLDLAAVALRDAGHELFAFSESMAAFEALDTPDRIALLIIRVNFPAGQR